jgi:hypothetical protein
MSLTPTMIEIMLVSQKPKGRKIEGRHPQKRRSTEEEV